MRIKIFCDIDYKTIKFFNDYKTIKFFNNKSLVQMALQQTLV